MYAIGSVHVEALCQAKPLTVHAASRAVLFLQKQRMKEKADAAATPQMKAARRIITEIMCTMSTRHVDMCHFLE